jgi:hypothetical protein
MFAGEFRDPSKARSREFLDADRSDADTLSDWAFSHSALLRSAAMLRSLWYFPTRRDFFRRATERVLGAESDPDIQEAALRLKVAPYYRDRWDASAPAFRSLEASVRRLAAAGPVAVVLTPQNPDFVDDAALFAANRALLADFFAARAIPGVEFRDWSARFAPDRFLDHCHLTADGNKEYAEEVGRWLDP